MLVVTPTATAKPTGMSWTRAVRRHGPEVAAAARAARCAAERASGQAAMQRVATRERAAAKSRAAEVAAVPGRARPRAAAAVVEGPWGPAVAGVAAPACCAPIAQEVSATAFSGLDVEDVPAFAADATVSRAAAARPPPARRTRAPKARSAPAEACPPPCAAAPSPRSAARRGAPARRGAARFAAAAGRAAAGAALCALALPALLFALLAAPVWAAGATGAAAAAWRGAAAAAAATAPLLPADVFGGGVSSCAVSAALLVAAAVAAAVLWRVAALCRCVSPPRRPCAAPRVASTASPTASAGRQRVNARRRLQRLQLRYLRWWLAVLHPARLHRSAGAWKGARKRRARTLWAAHVAAAPRRFGAGDDAPARPVLSTPSMCALRLCARACWPLRSRCASHSDALAAV